MNEDKMIINGEEYRKTNMVFDFTPQMNTVLGQLGSLILDACAEAGAMIAGGALTSAFTHTEIKDVDIYFRDKESMTKAFVKIADDWENVYLGHTDKSITIRDLETGATVQFIHFDYFDSLKSVFEAFDFTVCMAGIDLKTGELEMSPNFLSDVTSRTLHFNRGTRFPYISLIRTRKYQEKGYKIGKGTILAIANACANWKIGTWEQAKEQLGGVYGDEIDVQVGQDVEFTQDALHKLLTSIPEERSFSVNLEDYAKLYEELTGVKWNERHNDLPF